MNIFIEQFQVSHIPKINNDEKKELGYDSSVSNNDRKHTDISWFKQMKNSTGELVCK